jgi:hypothetical protein
MYIYIYIYITIRVWPRGIIFPSPLFINCPRCIIYTYTIKTSKFFNKMQVLFPHSILVLSSCIPRKVQVPLDFYYPYRLIPELLDISIQYANQLHLEVALFLHLNHIPINDMISIRYIIFKKICMEYITNTYGCR